AGHDPLTGPRSRRDPGTQVIARWATSAAVDPFGIDRNTGAGALNWSKERLDRILDGKRRLDSGRRLQQLRAASRESGSRRRTSLQTLNTRLTEAGIRNGYVAIPRRYAEPIFPSDVFGS